MTAAERFEAGKTIVLANSPHADRLSE